MNAIRLFVHDHHDPGICYWCGDLQKEKEKRSLPWVSDLKFVTVILLLVVAYLGCALVTVNHELRKAKGEFHGRSTRGIGVGE